jgi:hypothetical protein
LARVALHARGVAAVEGKVVAGALAVGFSNACSAAGGASITTGHPCSQYALAFEALRELSASDVRAAAAVTAAAKAVRRVVVCCVPREMPCMCIYGFVE